MTSFAFPRLFSLMALQNHKLAKHRSLSLILGFAVTVAIWLREVFSCRNFISPFVAPFWVMSIVGIYPGRALLIMDEVYVIKFYIYMWDGIWKMTDELRIPESTLKYQRNQE